MCNHVVVLGGDTPLGPALISGLEKEGYIVITSVSNPDTVAEIEATGNGYVRALVFDPKEACLYPLVYIRLLTNHFVAIYTSAIPPLPESYTDPSLPTKHRWRSLSKLIHYVPHTALSCLSSHSSAAISTRARAARASWANDYL